MQSIPLFLPFTLYWYNMYIFIHYYCSKFIHMQFNTVNYNSVSFIHVFEVVWIFAYAIEWTDNLFLCAEFYVSKFFFLFQFCLVCRWRQNRPPLSVLPRDQRPQPLDWGWFGGRLPSHNSLRHSKARCLRHRPLSKYFREFQHCSCWISSCRVLTITRQSFLIIS